MVDDEGEILFDGRDIRKNGFFKDIKLLRQEMGMVFQGGALFDSLTVENVRFPIDMFSSLSAAEKHKQVDFCSRPGKHQKVPTIFIHPKFQAECTNGLPSRGLLR